MYFGSMKRVQHKKYQRSCENASASVGWAPSEFWTIYGGYQTKCQGYELAVGDLISDERTNV